MSNLAHAFNTLHYAKRLKAAGVKEQEAEVHAETIAEAINILIDDTIATKSDVKYLELQIKSLAESTKSEIKQLEDRIMYRITIRLGAMLVGGFAIFGVIIKFL